ncbi:MAG: hypothetical protein HYT47_00435 [Candidatus Vogelbacteria bacterium]|nr:hypothetical protein [Candidatus Vogelbacteria bacterium]
MNHDQILKQVIMRRIYAIWLFRRLRHSFVLKLMLLSLLAWQLQFYVSPGAVWQNARLAGGFSNYGFFFSALERTETVVQLYFLAAGLLILWLFKDVLARLFRLSNRLGFFSRAHF